MAKRVLLITLFFLFVLKPEGYAQKIRFTGRDNNWLAGHTNYVDGTTYSRVLYGYRDTGIEVNGIAYKALAVSNGGAGIQVLVREDTLAGKVYFKSWRRGWSIGNGAYINDTTEFVVYDFSLDIGDTMVMPLIYGTSDTAISMHVLVQKDSVQINGRWHITQLFRCPLGFYTPWAEYCVVEGIGSLTDPVTPGPFNHFENSRSLSCFGNGDTLNPASIVLPFGPSQANFLSLASALSCGQLGTAGPAPFEISWKLHPNPATGEVIVDLSSHTAGEVYDLRIHDVLGKAVYAGTVKRQLRIPLSSWTPGYYLVTLSDAKGRRSTQRLAVH